MIAGLTVGSAGVLALTGCGGGIHPGAAAVVAGTSISVSQLTDTERGLAALKPKFDQAVSAGQAQGTFTNFLLSQEISTLVLQNLADKRKITVTDTEIDQNKSQLESQAPGSNSAAQDFWRQVAKAGALNAKLGKAIPDDAGRKALQKEVTGIAVSVNPRFGSWDAGNGVITDTNGSLSKALTSATPTP